LGFTGYREVLEHMLSNARLLSNALEASSWYRCVSNIHRKKGVFEYDSKAQVDGDTSEAYNPGLPVVAFTFSDEFMKEHPHVKTEAVSKMMRLKQYIIPNYPLPMNESDTEILRVVVRESMAMDLLDRLIADIFTVTESLVKIEGSFDIAEWEAFPKKASSSRGTDDLGRRLTAWKFAEGDAIHKSVC